MSPAVQRCDKILILAVKQNPMALLENTIEACVKLPERQAEGSSLWILSMKSNKDVLNPVEMKMVSSSPTVIKEASKPIPRIVSAFLLFSLFGNKFYSELLW